MKSCICHNMGGPWAYYATWNKSDGERQILYDFPHIKNVKNKKNPKIMSQMKQIK